MYSIFHSTDKYTIVENGFKYAKVLLVENNLANTETYYGMDF
jgi:hypothetical protein